MVGPNGAGKSTLLRIVGLLEKPTRGEVIYWDGSTLSRMERGRRRELARQMAMVFQEPLLFRGSVRENIAYGLKARGVGKKEREEEVERMIGRLGLCGLAGCEVSTLSGGEARKVSLGRALVIKPRLLLLDEPLSNVDTATRKEILRLLRELVREERMTAIYVSHDYHEVLEVADRMAVLVGGVLQQVGSPGEVFEKPATGEVAGFLGAENLLEGRVVSSRDGLVRVRMDGVELEAAGEAEEGAAVKVLIHPEEVALLAGPAGSGSARNRLQALVVETRSLGPMVRVDLDCGFRLTAYVTRASREEMGLRPGVEVTAVIKATSVHLMPFTRGYRDRETGEGGVE